MYKTIASTTCRTRKCVKRLDEHVVEVTVESCMRDTLLCLFCNYHGKQDKKCSSRWAVYV